MTRLPQWDRFLDGEEKCLWIHGIPGAGKTILLSSLVGNIEQRCDSTSQGNLCVYYYCYFAHQQDEAPPLVGWIINQLCREADNVPDHLWQLFKVGREPSLEDLLQSLEYALEPYSMVYVCVDAVDESSPRGDLLKLLRDLATDHRFAKIRLLVTSREYLDIERTMQEISTDISMGSPDLEDDIRLYTQARLDKEPATQAWPDNLRKEAVVTLTEGSKGM